MSAAWVEVWVDAASGYLLVLGESEHGRLVLTDPQRAGSVVRRFASYGEATAWLNEDEYDLVEGRWRPDAMRG